MTHGSKAQQDNNREGIFIKIQKRECGTHESWFVGSFDSIDKDDPIITCVRTTSSSSSDAFFVPMIPKVFTTLTDARHDTTRHDVTA